MGTLLGFHRGHFFSPNFGSRADDPSSNTSRQVRVFLYRKEHPAGAPPFHRLNHVSVGIPSTQKNRPRMGGFAVRRAAGVQDFRAASAALLAFLTSFLAVSGATPMFC